MEEKYDYAYQYTDNDYEKPKELFKFIANIIKSNMSGRKNVSILDVGCAKGEFLYYLKNRLSNCSPYLCGVDFSKTLLELAGEFQGLDGVDLHFGIAEEINISTKFDFITATGIISYYDDYSPFMENLFKHLRDDGVLIITNGYSVSEYDVLLKFRRYDQKGKWEKGWNQHSIRGISRYVERWGRCLKAHKFELPFKLKKTKDGLRSWTIDTDEGQRFVNSLNQIWNLWSLEIK